jgi:hypothetical protein
MKISAMNPTVTPWREGRGCIASTWHTTDFVRYYGANCPPDTVREVWHYTTLMGEFVLMDDNNEWSFSPLSVGHGSVSDQKAMNALLAQASSPVRMRRNGGVARYENKDNNLTIAVPTLAL